VGSLLGTFEAIRLDFFGWRVMGLRSLVYGDAPLPYSAMTATLTWVAVALLSVLCVMGGRSYFAFLRARMRCASDAGRAAVLVAAHAGIYLVALIAIWTLGNNDPIHTRFTAPMYWCLVLGFFIAKEAWRDSPRRHFLAGAALAFGLLVMVVNVDKSLALLGDSPNDHLIKKSLFQPSDLWLGGLSWQSLGDDLPPLGPNQ
jgi:hypothetical protein